MKTGKKSLAELSTYASRTLVQEERLAPPVHLGDGERNVWLQIVNDQPANSFTQVHIPQLESYCRHVVIGRMLADEVENFDRSWLADSDGLKRYDKLLGMHERESRAASSLATRLRITRQAIDQQTVARTLVNQKVNKKPWEIDG
jgi:hypothetical protein